MLNYSFYPFKNKLDELDSNDLLSLKKISEGWYIDYKSDTIKIPDIAKHLSAFANQYGGWLIFGIKEEEGADITASEFTGIADEEVAKLSIDIREASAAHINPEVLYEQKIISGPLDDIGLPSGKSILIVGIPMSQNTPHIHSSGRVYRRLADQSKPKAETDRFILDELWSRGKSQKEKRSMFLKKTPLLLPSQQNSTWAYIYFSPAMGQRQPTKKLKYEIFSSIVKNFKNDKNRLHAPMGGISSTLNGFSARQIEKNDASIQSLNFRWWHDGTVRIDIPLNRFNLRDFLKANGEKKYVKEFLLHANEIGYQNVEIIDYSNFIRVLAALTNSYFEMLNETGDKRDIYSCFTLKNIFNTLPFLDTNLYIERIKSYSIPLTLEKEIVFPAEPDESSMFLHKYEWRNPANINYKKDIAAILFSAPIFHGLFLSLGVINKIDDIESDNEIWKFDS